MISQPLDAWGAVLPWKNCQGNTDLHNRDLTFEKLLK